MSSSSQVMEERLNEYAKEIAALKAEVKTWQDEHSIVLNHLGDIQAENEALRKSQIDVRSKIDKIVIGWRNDWNEFDGRELKKQIDKVWAELPTYKEEK